MQKKRKFGSAPQKSAFKPRTKEDNFLLSVIMATGKMLFLTILILCVAGGGLLVGVAKAWVETMPTLDLSKFDEKAQTSFFYDKNGDLITSYRSTENRVDASYDEVPQYLKDAIVATEDQRFWEHNGMDMRRLAGVAIGMLTNGSSQGASTITQQLIKNTILTDDQTFKRKMQEIYLALELEQQISKEQILEEYMNIVYLGGSNYGVKVAAQDYFGKELSDLTLRECAMLARIIKSPTKYNPRRNYYTLNTPEVSEEGADYVLGLMHDQGLITDEEYNQAMNETLQVLQYSSASSAEEVENMYYVEYAIYDVVTKMLRVENLEDTKENRSLMESRLRTGGYEIYTSLDPGVQEAVQDVITDWDRYPKMRSSADSISKQSLGNGEYLEVVQPQAAATVIDWHTGELVAVVGGRSVPTGWKQLHRAQYTMPVGSSIKPLSVYGPAFDLGYSPGSPVLNLPISISGWDSETGFPENYGGGSYTGVESLRIAMNKSHNTATAQALMNYVGVQNAVNYLQMMDIEVEAVNQSGAGMALGTAGISTIDMAAAFGMIANGGTYLEPLAFSQVLNPDGTVYIDAYDVQIRRQVFKESTAWLLVDVLIGCVGANGTGSQANFGGFEVAGKTGTNSDYRGVFFAGMTGYYAGAVWIGSDDYKPLVSGASGGTYAAPLWAAVMQAVHSYEGITVNQSIRSKSAADVGLIKVEICSVSGMIPTSACRNDVNGYGTTTDYFLSGTEPALSCNMHRSVRLCTRTYKAPTSDCDTDKYGVIYMPEGHPLRNGVSTVVQQYFSGASTSKDTAEISKCTICSNDNDDTYDYANRYIRRANELLADSRLTAEQITKIEEALAGLQNAMVASNVEQVKSYTQTLRSYYYQITESWD